MRYSPSPLSLGIAGIRRLVESTDRAAARQAVRGLVAGFSAFQRDRCLENMRLVFAPLGWTSADIEKLRQAHVEFLVDYLYNLIVLARITPARFSQHVRMAGSDRLAEALRAGNGAIVVTSHLGSTVHLRAGLSAAGFRVANVSNKLPVAALEAIFHDIRQRFNIATTHVGKGGTALAERTLAQNGVFSLSFDISTPQRLEQSSWYRLGRAAIRLDGGPAGLVLRTGVPAFWGSVRTTTNGGTELGIEQLDVPAGSFDQNVAHTLTQEWIDKLYGEILERPAEWWHWNNLVLRPADGI